MGLMDNVIKKTIQYGEKPWIDTIIKDAEQYSAKQKQDFISNTAKEFLKNKAVKIKDTNLDYILTKSAKNDGYQITVMDNNVPLSDSQYPNLREAVKQLAEDISPMRFNRPDLPDTAPMGIFDKGAEYAYQYKYRPMSVGTQPEGFLRGDDIGKFGRVIYDRPLTADEINRFELSPTKLKGIVGAGVAASALSPSQAQAVGNQSYQQMIDQQGLQEPTFDPITLLSPTRWGGGLMNMGIDAAMKYITGR